jgi:hypothetical protein
VPQPSPIAALFFKVKLTLRLEDVAARAVPLEMQFFVSFVFFVVASLNHSAPTGIV